MAIGDDALDAGYPLVPDTGEEGRVRWGAREINRTRDFIANVLAIIPVGIAGYQAAAGFVFDTADANDADGRPDGTIYIKLVT